MRRQLGQVRPASTPATALFQPTKNAHYNIDLINIVNVGSVTANVSLFHDKDGSTYDETTALLWQCPLYVGETIQIEMAKGFADYLLAGSVAAQTSVSNAVTFTCYGEIEGERV